MNDVAATSMTPRSYPAAFGHAVGQLVTKHLQPRDVAMEARMEDCEQTVMRLLPEHGTDTWPDAGVAAIVRYMCRSKGLCFSPELRRAVANAFPVSA